ncbi:MAG: hypothetical protein ACI91J_003231, partial [Yoonia sp.]
SGRTLRLPGDLDFRLQFLGAHDSKRTHRPV